MKCHFLLVLIVLAIFTGTAHAQEPLYGCRMTYDSSNHVHFNINISEPTDVVAVYEYRNQHFVLRDTHTREILKVLEANLLVDRFGESWSPDCRYILGSYNNMLVAWDSQTGARLGTVTPWGRVYWNPASDYAVVDAWEYAYLWHIPSNTQTILTAPAAPNNYGRLHRVGWDNQRRQVFVVHGGSGHILHVYDMNNGQPIASLQTLSEAAPVNFKLSPDGSHIAVFTSDKERWEYVSLIGYYRQSRVSVFNRDNWIAQHLIIKGNEFAAGLAAQVAFSPDNRYLAIGREKIRVWDLQQLPENFEDRLPTYTFTGPQARIGFARFVDNTTLETQSIEASAGTPYFRWNVVTGEFVNTYDAVHDITSTVRP